MNNSKMQMELAKRKLNMLEKAEECQIREDEHKQEEEERKEKEEHQKQCYFEFNMWNHVQDSVLKLHKAIHDETDELMK